MCEKKTKMSQDLTKEVFYATVRFELKRSSQHFPDKIVNSPEKDLVFSVTNKLDNLIRKIQGFRVFKVFVTCFEYTTRYNLHVVLCRTD